ncbi:MAG: c-type cytochrome [Candidatus Tectomicrobia bacterium]|nr:c-type cytochrome [Candidatus Tectomicrobia bacterium]
MALFTRFQTLRVAAGRSLSVAPRRSSLLLFIAVSLAVAVGFPPRGGGAQAQENLVARGKYLAVNVAHCIGCHSPIGAKGQRIARLEFSGVPAKNVKRRQGPPQNVGFPGPAGMRAYPKNITPDPETGIGSWTEADFLRAFKEGVNPQGKKYAYTQMEWETYRGIRDEDLRAMYAYLRTVPAVKNAVPKNIPAKAPASKKKVTKKETKTTTEQPEKKKPATE